MRYLFNIKDSFDIASIFSNVPYIALNCLSNTEFQSIYVSQNKLKSNYVIVKVFNTVAIETKFIHFSYIFNNTFKYVYHSIPSEILTYSESGHLLVKQKYYQNSSLMLDANIPTNHLEKFKLVITLANIIKSLDCLSLVHGKINPSTIFKDKTQNEYYLSDSFLFILFNENKLNYTSPEQLCGKEITIETDIWSFGCVIYYIYTNGQSFFTFKRDNSKMEMYECITKTIKNSITYGTIEQLFSIPNYEYMNNLLIRTLDINSNSRILPSEILLELKYINSKKFSTSKKNYIPKDDFQFILANVNSFYINDYLDKDYLHEIAYYVLNNNDVYYLQKYKYSNIICEIIKLYINTRDEKYYFILIQLCIIEPSIKNIISNFYSNLFFDSNINNNNSNNNRNYEMKGVFNSLQKSLMTMITGPFSMILNNKLVELDYVKNNNDLHWCLLLSNGCLPSSNPMKLIFNYLMKKMYYFSYLKILTFESFIQFPLQQYQLNSISNNIKYLTNLRILEFNDCSIDIEWKTELIRKNNHFNFFQNMKNLKQLWLNNCRISTKDLRLFCESFSCLKKLIELHVCEMELTKERCLVICKTFKDISGVETLVLSKNKITNKDMIFLSQHICSLSNIKSLHLDNNKISDDGIIELANKLQYMRQLNSIFLFNNKIKNAGIRLFVMNLSILKSLKSLSISGNNYDNDELIQLKSIMKKYTQLTNVYY